MPKRTKSRIQFSNQKRPAPLAKFTLKKRYIVQLPAAGAAPQQGALMQINMSSPFKPMTAISGTWIDQDSSITEPYGLSSDIYGQYRHVVVLASHASVIVRDSPDVPAAGNYNKVEGTVSLTRTTDTGIVVPTTLNSALRMVYGSRQKLFVMAASGVSNLTKNARLDNGYSARKTFHCPATSNNQLWINNQTGSSNIPADNTYMMLLIRPSEDTLSGSTLKDFNVELSLTFTIRFLEPTAPDNIPLPISLKSSSFYPRGKSQKKSTEGPSIVDKMKYLWQAGQGAAASAAYYGYKYHNALARGRAAAARHRPHRPW